MTKMTTPVRSALTGALTLGTAFCLLPLQGFLAEVTDRTPQGGTFEAPAQAPPPASAFEIEASILHLRLNRTAPAADSTVTGSPEEIRLFFSEPPQMRGTSVRLADTADNLVPSTEAVADEDDPRQVWINPSAPLSPGSYTVHWRVIAQDGHTQRGNFTFRVRAPEEAAAHPLQPMSHW